MSLAGGIWVRDESFAYTFRPNSFTESMLSGISISTTTTKNYKDFGYQNNIYERSRIKEHDTLKNKIKLGNGEVMDLDWLISKG